MMRFFLKGMLPALLGTLAMSNAGLAQDTISGGCSNRILNGSYAFRFHGQFLGLASESGPQYFPSPVPVDSLAMVHFDGNGNFTRVDYTVLNGMPVPAPPSDIDPQSGFTSNDTGRYSIYPDCTGDLKHNLPDLVGGSIAAKVVLSSQGREIHAIIYREHVASPILGCTNPAGCDALVNTSGDGKRLGQVR